MSSGRTTARPRGKDAEFFAIAEAGALEAQALLLCESIRRFAGAYSTAPITIVSPRADRRPARATLRALDAMQVDYLALDIDSECPEYGTSYRVHAAAHLEKRAGPEILVQLDSDTLFLDEPDFSLTSGDVAARPVDVKGMCTRGVGDPSDAYWRALCRVCEVDYDALPQLVTTVDRETVRASYNGGLIAARRDAGIFVRAEDVFARLVRNELRSYEKPTAPVKIGAGFVSPEGFAFWGTSQAAISIACAGAGVDVELLPSNYNVPLHYVDRLDGAATDAPIHVHYHWLGLASESAANPLLDGRLTLSSDRRDWLRARMPFD